MTPERWVNSVRHFNEFRADGGIAGLGRGFVEVVSLSAADWLAHADAIRRQHPVTRVVWTTRPEGSVTRAERLREWKQPPELGGHVLDCWRAEWPGVTFELPGAAPRPGDILYDSAGNPVGVADHVEVPPPDQGPSPFRGAYPAWAATRGVVTPPPPGSGD